jgi:hypothetical protein
MSRGRNQAEEARRALQMMLLPDLHKRLRFPEIPAEESEDAPAGEAMLRGPRAMKVKCRGGETEPDRSRAPRPCGSYVLGLLLEADA